MAELYIPITSFGTDIFIFLVEKKPAKDNIDNYDKIMYVVIFCLIFTLLTKTEIYLHIIVDID